MRARCGRGGIELKQADLEWTLITVTYNNADELREWWSGTDLSGAKWIVVDNNSSDGTADYAAALGAQVIRLPSNVGFSRANNAALNEVTTRFVAFVNPDVRVDAASLPLIGRLVRQYDAIVCPQLCNPDGSTQPNGRGLPYLVDKLAHRGIKLPGSSLSSYIPDTSEELTYVAWAMGAAVCGETLKVRAIGGWDERYFLYYEDHAFGLEAWTQGVKVMIAPQVRWTHAWKRETKAVRVKPWIHEIASASRFYSRHPELLAPIGFNARDKWKGIRHAFGEAVSSPTGGSVPPAAAND